MPSRSAIKVPNRAQISKQLMPVFRGARQARHLHTQDRARHDPSRLLPPAAESRGAPRHWCPTAPDHRRSPAPGPQASPRRRPVARGHIAGEWTPDAPALVASSIGARTRRPSAPSAVGGFSRCTTVHSSVPWCRLIAVLPLRGCGAQLVLQQLAEQPQEALAIRRRAAASTTG